MHWGQHSGQPRARWDICDVMGPLLQPWASYLQNSFTCKKIAFHLMNSLFLELSVHAYENSKGHSNHRLQLFRHRPKSKLKKLMVAGGGGWWREAGRVGERRGRDRLTVMGWGSHGDERSSKGNTVTGTAIMLHGDRRQPHRWWEQNDI